MTGFSYYTAHDARSYTRGRRGNRPEFIVIHHWGVDGQRFWGVINFFKRSTYSSAHLVISDGRVAQIIADSDTAWHAGRWDANLQGIGYECRPEATAGDIETVAMVVALHWHRWPHLRGRKLRWHSQFMATACPGRYKKLLQRIYDRATYYYPLTDPQTPGQLKSGVHIVKPRPGEIGYGHSGVQVQALQRIMKSRYPGYYPGAIDGDFGPSTMQAVAKFQSARGLTPDGVVGKKTLSALARDGYWLPPRTDRATWPSEWLVYGDQGGAVRQLQETLLEIVPGLCAHSSTDGVFGLWTLTSVGRLQTTFGLYPDLMVGPKTAALIDHLTTIGKAA